MYRNRRQLSQERLRRIRATTPAAAPATNPASGVFSQSVGSSSSFTQAYDAAEQLKYNNEWVFACTSVIAKRVASQQINVAVQVRGRQPRKSVTHGQFKSMPIHVQEKAATLEVVEQHPILDMFESPNPIMVQWQVMYTLATHMMLAGKHGWWLVNNAGEDQLWPVSPTDFSPIHRQGQLFAGWKIGTRDAHEVGPEDFAYFSFPHESDPYTGCKSTLRAMARSVLADGSILTSQHAAFLNGIFPGMAVIVGEIEAATGEERRPELTAQQIQEMRQAIDLRMKGPERAGAYAILDSLIRDIKPLTTVPREMDFNQSASMTKSRITQGFSVNPIVLGQVEGANRASSVVADAHFCQNAVNPILTLASQVMTRLFNRRNSGGRRQEQVQIWWTLATPQDREMTLAEWQLGLQGYAVRPNDLRTQVLDQPPLDGGDVIYKPFTVVGETAETKGVTPRRSITRRAKSYERSAFISGFLKQHGKLETDYQQVIESFFAEQLAAIQRELEGVNTAESGESLVDRIYDPRQWDQQLADTTVPAVIRAMLVGAQFEMSLHGEARRPRRPDAAPESLDRLRVVDVPEMVDEVMDLFSLELPEEVLAGIVTSIQERVTKRFLQDINDTTRNRLATALQQGIEEGESIRDLQDRLSSVLGSSATKARALGIARTETTSAMGSGSLESLRQLADDAVVSGKVWIATLDQNTRDDHLAADGQEVGVDEPFIVGGEEAMYPGDPSLSAAQSVSCRCAVTGVTLFGRAASNGHMHKLSCTHGAML